MLILKTNLEFLRPPDTITESPIMTALDEDWNRWLLSFIVLNFESRTAALPWACVRDTSMGWAALIVACLPSLGTSSIEFSLVSDGFR